MQEDVVLLLADAAAFANFHGHRPAHHVAAGQILGGRRITFHEPLALAVGEVAALTARAFRDQTARPVDAGRVELDEFHILHRQPGAEHHAGAVAGASMRRGGGEIDASAAAGGQNRLLGAETVDRPVIEVPGHDAPAFAIFHDQVEGEIFDVELGLVLERLLVQRVQHRVACPVRRRAGPLRLRPFAEMRRHASERALIDLAVRRAAERHAVMLQLDDRRHRLAAHIFDRVLVAQPVRPLDGVVHMPLPTVFAHIAERSGNATLRRHGMAAGREDLGNAGGLEPPLGEAERCAQSRTAGADDDDVIGMIDNRVCLTHGASPPKRYF